MKTYLHPFKCWQLVIKRGRQHCHTAAPAAEDAQALRNLQPQRHTRCILQRH